MIDGIRGLRDLIVPSDFIARGNNLTDPHET